MTYEVFCARVFALASQNGARVAVSHKDGRHIARYSDGTTIVGNIFCPRVSVEWGDGHRAFAYL